MRLIHQMDVIGMLRRFRGNNEYLALKKTCEANVVEWRWATGCMLPQLPHQETIYGWPPLEWVKEQPRIGSLEVGSLHGLNATGQIIAIRSDVPTKPDDEVLELFLIHEDDGFWRLAYSDNAAKRLDVVTW